MVIQSTSNFQTRFNYSSLDISYCSSFIMVYPQVTLCRLFTKTVGTRLCCLRVQLGTITASPDSGSELPVTTTTHYLCLLYLENLQKYEIVTKHILNKNIWLESESESLINCCLCALPLHRLSFANKFIIGLISNHTLHILS